jgi:hypothetical protein
MQAYTKLTKYEAVKLIKQLQIKAEIVYETNDYDFDIICRSLNDKAVFEEHTEQPFRGQLGNHGEYIIMVRPWFSSAKRY